MDDDDLTSRRPPGREPETARQPEAAEAAQAAQTPGSAEPVEPAQPAQPTEHVEPAESAGQPVAAEPPGAAGTPAAAGKPKRSLRRKILLRSALVLVILAGLLFAGGTYYYDQVGLPENVALQQATTIYYADGTTVMARIGDTNRTLVAIQDVPVDVQHAVVAAQDETFYTNSGVDYWEATGAVWNHVAGDGRHGGSTISQQYARHLAQLHGASFGRKTREAVIATKLNNQYSKEQILEMYLNIVYFGRGAYGLQAAAQAYFGKPARELTVAEGAVLAGLIDNPEGSEGKGSPFDPTVDAGQAHARFDEIKRKLVELKFVQPQDADQRLAYPTKVLTADQARANATAVRSGLDRAEGLIVHHVLAEVAALTDPKTGTPLYEGTDPGGAKHFDRIRNGGLKIVTTVDEKLQKVAVREASRNPESRMAGQPANLQAALVAVEPGTGAVKAYYGGDSGAGGDYAGSYADPVLADGTDSCCGGHPAGAAFGPYVLATGLMAGYSVDSYWDGSSPQEFPGAGRTVLGGNPVRNVGEHASAPPACASGSPRWCTLAESTVLSLNTPYFALTDKVGGARVIDTARAAGIGSMWAYTGNGAVRRIDLTRSAGSEVFPKYFNTEVGLGQYPVTVLDQAGGMATFAARGLAAKTHFLKQVWEHGKQTYGEVVNPRRVPGFTEPMADDLNAVLQAVPAHYNLKLKDGRPIAGAAGSWLLGNTPGVAHAWMVGYTAADPKAGSPGLAVAVWVGNKEQEQKLVDAQGRAVVGGTLPGTVWQDFLDGAVQAVAMPVATFAPRANTGDKKVGTGASPTP
jgi:membrane peptidoglycan carboxypeptidase